MEGLYKKISCVIIIFFITYYLVVYAKDWPWLHQLPEVLAELSRSCPENHHRRRDKPWVLSPLLSTDLTFRLLILEFDTCFGIVVDLLHQATPIATVRWVTSLRKNHWKKVIGLNSLDALMAAACVVLCYVGLLWLFDQIQSSLNQVNQDALYN